jgi:hypothetical protein
MLQQQQNQFQQMHEDNQNFQKFALTTMVEALASLRPPTNPSPNKPDIMVLEDHSQPEQTDRNSKPSNDRA